jgi:hypothetical protein
MYSAISAALGVVVLISFAPGVSAEGLSKELVALIHSNPEAVRAELARGDKERAASTKLKMRANNKSAPQTQNGDAASPTSDEPDAITKLLLANANKLPGARQYSPCAGWVFVLRQNWKDIGSLAGASCPDAPTKAQGAQISFANDKAANNQVVTINGTAAAVYNSITGDVPGQPYAVSFGAYTSVNNVSNSATSQMKSNLNTLAYGGLLNLGYSNDTGGHYFSLRGGAVQDFVKDTTAANAVLQWSPVFTPLYVHDAYHFFPSWGIPIITRFDPNLVARFDSATGTNQLLAFNNKRDSLRLGPELGLLILPDPGYVSGPLSRFSALVGYNIWYETYSKKRITWFTSSLTYNLDEDGNFGLQGTYNTGQDENVGKWTNIYTIGLSFKI